MLFPQQYPKQGGMFLSVPGNLLSLTTSMLCRVQPAVHNRLTGWKTLASRIPDAELRRQALASIQTKAFHCEGGAVYGLLAEKNYKEAIKFIVAYQTISDYLDNLCDRSTSSDPNDFQALHEAMLHALTPDAQLSSYYRFRKEQDDGGYLAALVTTCQKVLQRLSNYYLASTHLHDLASCYCELQINKHVCKEERVQKLRQWSESKKKSLHEKMAWYEFAACTGSTLGIFCLISSLLQPQITDGLLSKIKKAYFPWVQGLHILLDYFIDQEEDRIGQDLNFCAFYPNEIVMINRLTTFYIKAMRSVSLLPHRSFHRLTIRGLLSIYLSDEKVFQQKDVRQSARILLRFGGTQALFLYLHCRSYRRLKRLAGKDF
jgi:tetraprenyl-beta-curcumene synthase